MIMAKAANTSNKQIETLADLTPDPRNARKHNPRNVGMLEKSLNEVGAARSIVIDENGVVLAGNATIEAAGRAGIERVQVVDADGETIVAVRRTGLTQTQKTRLALYDNRTAELADWDAEVIASLVAEDEKVLDGLFDNNELLAVLDNDDTYTSIVQSPIYKITSDKPSLHELVDRKKHEELITEINKSKINQDEKQFLQFAAQRHIVFNYAKIAEYYAHSEISMQNLMENSALVIIDFNKAIEKGFVKLQDMLEQLATDNA